MNKVSLIIMFWWQVVALKQDEYPPIQYVLESGANSLQPMDKHKSQADGWPSTAETTGCFVSSYFLLFQSVLIQANVCG